MDIIQLKCGHCQQVMAISVAHLGQQVHCPHCQGVVQTPPPSTPPSPDATEPGGFAKGPPPVETPQFSRSESAPFSSQTDNTVVMDSAGASSAADSSSQTDFTQFKPRPRYDRGVFLLIALIFLVPYAVTITVFLAILLLRGQGESDSLQYIRDPMPAPKNGGPKKVQAAHDSPLVAQRKTTLGQPVKAGDLEVTPKRIVLTKEGDLKIFLRAKNISANTAFEPMHDSYVHQGKSTIPPYTFLETHSKESKEKRIYGFNLAYYKTPDATDEQSGYAVLMPREQVTIVLMSEERYRPLVAAMAKETNDDYTWRVQLRRGFVKVDNKDVSATTVIGVDFSSKDIERDGKH
jgi:hypothetical protein